MAKGFRVTLKTLQSEVTGTAFILKIKRPGRISQKILIDFGGYQEEKYNILNEVIEFEPTEIDATLVTHAHLDHIFKLPLLYKNGYLGQVYCSNITKTAIPISLMDSLKIMEGEYLRDKKDMLYNISDVNRTIENLTSLPFNKPSQIIPDVSVTLLSNGHLYGAASILLQISCKKYDDINLLFSGDYYEKNELFNVKPFPDFVYDLKNLSIITECTYATTKISDIEKTFNDYILNAVNNNRFIVIPSISLERLELILLRLKTLQEDNLLDTSIPIYIHSELGKQYYNAIYKNGECIDVMPTNCEFIAKGDYETVLNDKRFPKILLASSGMADKGNILYYLPRVISDDRVTIIFTCYQSKSTLGYRIKNSTLGERIVVNKISQKRLCDVKCTSEFSHHIKQDQSIAFFNKFSSLSNIFLNHGEIKTMALYNAYLKEIFENKGIYTTNREIGYRISSDSTVSAYRSSLKSLDYYHKLHHQEENLKFRKFPKKRCFKKTS